MDGHPYLAIALVALIAGATTGTKVFGSKLGGALTALLVCGFFAGFRAALLSFT